MYKLRARSHATDVTIMPTLSHTQPTILDPHHMSHSDWCRSAGVLCEYVQAFEKLGASHLIGNLETEIRVLQDDEIMVPVTVNQREYDNTYVCSPYTAFVSYSKAE